MVDDVDVAPMWDGGYIRFDGLETGQVAAIVYPLREIDRRYQIGESEYLGHWRGSTMLSIEPQGQRYPIYRRQDLLREPAMPARLVTDPSGAERRAIPAVLW